MEIDVMYLYRHDDRSDIVIKQIGRDKFRIINKSYNKLNYVIEKTKDDIKGLIIDFIVNGYTIKQNIIFQDIVNEIFDYIENYKPEIKEEIKEEDNEIIKKIEF